MRNSVSPLRYPGGKACLVPFLASVISANGYTDGVLVEPYAGSAAAALHLLVGEYVERIVINDFDPAICSFWWAVLNRTDQVCDFISSCEITIAKWRQHRDIYLNASRSDDFKVACATLFLNRCNRSGIIATGGPIGGYAQSGKWKLDARFNREALIDRVSNIGNYADRIELHNRDGLDFLRNVINRRCDAKRTLAFIDPPYFKKSERLYNSDFVLQSHSRIARFLLGSRPRLGWILTYDDCDAFHELYGNDKHTYTLSHSAYKRRDGGEALAAKASLVLEPELLPGGSKYY